MKLYLAGPMRGYPLHNFPAFDNAAKLLREMGHEVANPADHDRSIGFSEHTEEVAPDMLAAMFRWDLAQVMDSDGVVFLPGWMRSKGACAERTVAHYLGIPCFDYWMNEILGKPALVPQQRFCEPIISWVPEL